MSDANVYNPCSECKFKINFGCCPMGQRRKCPTWMLADILQTDKEAVDKIPDNLLIDVLRKRGWHGELKQTTLVTI